ncbi:MULTISPECIES: cytochrome c [unclassified Rhodosalinus]|uniref:c-type cytochrome n=1 Tax=unclassified Rhodosalinus TaxID=2630183 RepID=UPI003525E3B4
MTMVALLAPNARSSSLNFAVADWRTESTPTLGHHRQTSRVACRLPHAAVGLHRTDACHGKEAQGVASYPQLSDKAPDYIANRLKTYRAGARVGPDSVPMIQTARDISDTEIASLAVHVTRAFDRRAKGPGGRMSDMRLP